VSVPASEGEGGADVLARISGVRYEFADPVVSREELVVDRTGRCHTVLREICLSGRRRPHLSRTRA
jgi:hypothetical protein